LCCVVLCAGKGVTMYLLDSGIRKSHQEFAPWDGSSTNRITVGPDFVDDDGSADDCDGHGTHVASTGVHSGTSLEASLAG
jgi:subtilisin family serine protease